MIEDFIKVIIADFSSGDLEKVAQAFSYPSRIDLGDRALMLRCPADLLNVLRIYRANLKVESHVRSEVKIEHRSETPDGRVQILATVSHYNDQGGEISSGQVSYFCRKAPDGSWKVFDHEILPPITERLATGLPMV